MQDKFRSYPRSLPRLKTKTSNKFLWRDYKEIKIKHLEAQLARQEESYKRRIEFLKQQIDIKDDRIDKRDEMISKLIDSIINHKLEGGN